LQKQLIYGKVCTEGDFMETLMMIISILLIVIVLLQSGKAEAGSFGSGVSSDLFADRKERGSELVITRITAILGILFFVIAIVMQYY